MSLSFAPSHKPFAVLDTLGSIFLSWFNIICGFRHSYYKRLPLFLCSQTIHCSVMPRAKIVLKSGLKIISERRSKWSHSSTTQSGTLTSKLILARGYSPLIKFSTLGDVSCSFPSWFIASLFFDDHSPVYPCWQLWHAAWYHHYLQPGLAVV